MLCNDKIYDVLVAISKTADSKFKFQSEANFDMANPLRACFGPDVTQQFDRRDLYRMLVDGKFANRCQKPVWQLRWVVLEPFDDRGYRVPLQRRYENSLNHSAKLCRTQVNPVVGSSIPGLRPRNA